MKEIRIKCWVECDGEKLFGPGPLRLLQLIEQDGSIAKAAKSMGMSYKKAWDIVNRLNGKARNPIVISKKGGTAGGGAQLTEYGRELMERYESLSKKLTAVVNENKEILEEF